MGRNKLIEEKVLRRENSYRRARAGGLFLAGITLLVLILIIFVDPSEEAFLASSSVQVLFWLAVAYGAHARIQHANSLKGGDRK